MIRRWSAFFVRAAPALLLAAGLLSPASASPGRQAEPSVLAALRETAASEAASEGARAKAARSLGWYRDAAAASLLRRLMRQERSLDIRLSSACALTELGDLKSPLDLLLATAYGGERTPHCTRGDLLLALGRTRNVAGELHLKRALAGEAPGAEPGYWRDLLQSLYLLATPAAHVMLLDALNDPRAEVAVAAVSPATRIAKTTDDPLRPLARRRLVESAQRVGRERSGAQAASALFWDGVDGNAFWRMLEQAADPAIRIRAARVLRRYYLTPARLERTELALAAESHPEVRHELEATVLFQMQRPVRARPGDGVA